MAGSSIDFEIAPGVRTSAWKKLQLNDSAQWPNSDWITAIKIFESRLTSRFFNPIDAMIALEDSRNPKSYGFVVLAIDCLLIETIQGFREGVLNHSGKSRSLFTSFLKNWGAFQQCVPKSSSVADRANQFYTECRSALHHTASTGPAFRVRVSGPLLNFGSTIIELNRSRFHQELRLEFSKYVSELCDPSRSKLRHNFKLKMDHISS